jgi:hypothetical protein
MADEEAQIDMLRQFRRGEESVQFGWLHAHARHAGINLQDGGQAAALAPAPPSAAPDRAN